MLMNNLVSVLKEVKMNGVDLWVENESLKFRTENKALDDALKEKISFYKQEIISWLTEQKSPLKQLIIPAGTEMYFPLTNEQMLFWRASQLSEKGYEYNIPYAFLIDGHFNVDRFYQSIELLVNQEPMLRVRFYEKDGAVYQTPVDMMHFNFPVSISNLDDTNKVIELHCLTLAKTTFDLHKGCCFLVDVAKLSDNRFLICFVFHHIISDAHSIQLVFNKIKKNYNELLIGKKNKMDEITYLDYAFWQSKSAINSEKLQCMIEQFSELPERSVLPVNKNKTKSNTQYGSNFKFEFNQNLSDLVIAFSAKNNISINTILLSVYFVLLRKYARFNKQCVGIPVSTVNSKQKQKLIGPMLNSFALLLDVHLSMSFRDLLNYVNDELIACLSEVDNLPFTKIITEVSKKNNQSVELFNTMFIMQPFENNKMMLDDCVCREIDIPLNFSKFDLTFSVRRNKNKLVCNIEYKTDLFTTDIIHEISHHYLLLLDQLLNNDSELIYKTKLFNGDDFLLPKKVNFKEGIVAQLFYSATHFPKAIAVYDDFTQLTYEDLLDRAVQLSECIKTKSEKNIVGVFMERSVDAIVGILAITLSKKAFLPMDTENPSQRVNYIIDDSAIDLLLTDQHSADLIDHPINKIIISDFVFTSTKIKISTDNINNHHLAYIIYTSGSTGDPKGVMVSHQNLLHYTQWVQDAYLKKYHVENVLLHSSLAFDLTLTCIFAPLCLGKSIYIPKGDGLEVLPAYVRSHQNLGLIKLTPSHLRLLLNLLTEEELSEKSGLFIVGGEALYSSELKQFLQKSPELVFINEYGPTETTVGCAQYIVDRNTIHQFEHQDAIPIGYAIDRMKILIVDEKHQLCPAFIPGEIMISGCGVSNGYLNKAELTEEKFIVLNGEKFYKSGDLGIKNEKDALIYLGRIDDQIKFNGFRIELGEIESKLMSLSVVREAVVFVIKNNLTAFVVFREDRESNMNIIFDQMMKMLPHYMQPRHYVSIEKIPLTINGKIDKANLIYFFNTQNNLKQDVDSSFNKKQLIILKIWESVFGTKRIALDTSFFELGGDSIKVLQITGKLREFGFLIRPRDIYQYSSIRLLSNYLKMGNEKIIHNNQAAENTEQAVLPAMQWFLDLPHNNINHYNQSFRYQINGVLDKACFSKAIEAVIDQHPALRLRYDKNTQKTFYSNVGSSYTIQEINHNINTLNQSHLLLNIFRGPVLFFGIIQNDSSNQELLIIVHHFVVDAVSWSILMMDLESAYFSVLHNKDIMILSEKTSVKEWHDYLQNYCYKEEFSLQEQYWVQLSKTYGKRYFTKNNIFSSGNYKKTELRLKALLLKNLHNYFSCSAESILLSLVASGLFSQFDEKKLLIMMERHGRELINDHVDLSRTIGWLTSQFPVALDFSNSFDEQTIKNCFLALNAIPDKGIGFGVLKYLTSTHDVIQNCLPDICFNYLGELGSDAREGALFTLLDKPTGLSIDTTLQRQFALELNCYLYGEELIFELFYDANRVSEFWISEFKKSLELLYTKLAVNWTSDHLKEKQFGLAPLQKGLLYHAATQSSDNEYITQVMWDIHSTLDIKRFQKAWNEVVSKVEVLRTYYSLDGQMPQQHVLTDYPSEIVMIDLKQTPESMQLDKMTLIFKAQRDAGFNLFVAPPYRALLVILSPDKFIFVWTHHHIMMDGWSLNNLKLILEKSYNEQEALPFISYHPYIEFIEHKNKNASIQYWNNKFVHYEHTEMPILNCDTNMSSVGDLDFTLDQNLSDAISNFSHHYSVTENAIIQSVFSILMGHYKGTDDISFGMTFSYRPYELAHIQEAIGLYINTLPIRAALKNHSFLSLSQTLQQQILDSVEYGDIGLTDFGKLCGIEKPSELIRELVVFENYPAGLNNYNFKLKLENMRSIERAAVGLVLVVAPGVNYQCKLSFDHNRYSEQSIERIRDQFINILNQALDNPTILLSNIQVPTLSQRNQLLFDWNKTETIFLDEQKTLHDYLDVSADKYTNKIALDFEGDQLSYLKFKKLADRYAGFLKSKGLALGDYCVVHLERSLDLIPIIFAVLKCGGVLVPLETHYPSTRKLDIINDCHPKIIISDEVFENNAHWITTADLKSVSVVVNNNLSLPLVKSSDLAYVIYTSGSTGKPKGVLIDHSSATNMVEIIKAQFNLSDSSNVLMFASISFDAAIADWASTVAAGGTLYLPCRERLLDPHFLVNYTNENKISVMVLPPSLLATLPEKSLQTVKTLVSVGEPCPLNIVKKWANGRTFINGYGPTEATVCTTFSKLSGNERIVTIGKPAQNKKVYVLDENKNPVAIGAPGELYISGKGLSSGYLNKNEMTNQHFIPNCYDDCFLMYKSGDKVRWLENGNLEYLSRIDTQVQIRGYRVELSEITKVLESHPSVSQSHIIVVGSADSIKLIAYIVPFSGSTIQIALLSGYLKSKLPEFMLPQHIFSIEKFPLTQNGKIDSAKLQTLFIASIDSKKIDECISSSTTEEKIVSIFQKLLEQSILPDDDFFDYGGHSLLAVKLANEIEKNMQYRVSLAHLFELRTSKNIADYINAIKKIAEVSEIENKEELVL